MRGERLSLQGDFNAREAELRRRILEVSEAQRRLDRFYNSEKSEKSDFSSADERTELENALARAKEEVDRIRLTTSHFRCFLPRKKSGEPYAEEYDVEVGSDSQVLVALVALTSEPTLPNNAPNHCSVVIKPCEGGSFEILMGLRRRDIDELVKISANVPPPHAKYKAVLPSDCRGFYMEWKDKTKDEFYTQHFEELEETLGIHLKRYKKNKVARVTQVKELWALQRVAYDKNNPDHEKELMELWTLINPDQPLESRVSPQWKSIGFQGNDPATDFRGMGMLGLRVLLFAARHRLEDVKTILNNKQDYPFAAASINVVYLMFEKLNFKNTTKLDSLFHSSEEFDTPLMHFFCRVPSEERVFEEVCCSLLVLLDSTFQMLHASYMDFPKVLNSVKRELDELLLQRPLTVEQFRFLCQQRIQTHRLITK